MPELFHPDLPGVSSELSEGWRRSGWLPWDELTEEQQAAHTAAVSARLKEAAAVIAQGGAALGEVTDALSAAWPAGVDWDALTIPELRTYAEQRGIDLGDLKKKPDIVAAIEAAEKQNTESTPNVGDTTKE